jgi:hypothetical protein
MEAKWAEDNLQTIRSLMERSALYRRAMGPVTLFTGVAGIVAAVAGFCARINSVSGLSIYWMAVSIVVILGDLWLVRRQAIKAGEEFWSPPMRRVAQAMMPALLIGAVLGIMVLPAFFKKGDENYFISPLIAMWTCLFGIALHAAGFFMMRGIRLFAFLFILTGIALLTIFAINPEWLDSISPHLKMGVVFGGFHLVYGIYLTLTETRQNET